MRTSFLMAALVASLSFAGSALADELSSGTMLSDYTLGNTSMGGCNSCGGGQRCGHLGHKLHRNGCGHHRGPRYEGRDPGFNCGCQGSYKFPVPPQYTYFWPGSVYSQQLMTNYHSPWRFPPLKPYTDEKLEPAPIDAPADGLRPVANYEELAAPQLRAGQIEPMSSAMQRFFR